MKILKILSVILGLAFLVQSCDKIDPPYKKPGTSVDCEVGNQNVLIEDYTGHKCVNCPGAAITAHEIKAMCEERVVIIAVHAGYFAEPNETGDYAYDFRTDAGNDWNSFFGIVSNPNGVVNRTNEDGSYLLSPGQWASKATELLAQNSPVNIEIENSFSDNALSTTIKANFVDNAEGNYKLIVCITEDNIIKPQKNNDHNIGDVPNILDYKHMHVLRAAINGNWGQSLLNGSAAIGETISKTYTQKFDDTDWVAENCNVVAFIYDNADKSVVQVKEAKVIE